MGSKIYVGGLPYSTAEQELADLFGQHGAVTSAKIITDKYTGQSRGFGFVEMADRKQMPPYFRRAVQFFPLYARLMSVQGYLAVMVKEADLQ